MASPTPESIIRLDAICDIISTAVSVADAGSKIEAMISDEIGPLGTKWYGGVLKSIEIGPSTGGPWIRFNLTNGNIYQIVAVNWDTVEISVNARFSGTDRDLLVFKSSVAPTLNHIYNLPDIASILRGID